MSNFRPFSKLVRDKYKIYLTLQNVKMGKTENPHKMRTKRITNRKEAPEGRENKAAPGILSEYSPANVAGLSPILKCHFGGQCYVSDAN
jgi:hypothetical protein